MGWASEQMIEELNRRYETDAEFRREYDEARQIEAAEEAHYFAQEIENEKLEDWFIDKLIDYRGVPVALPPAPIVLIDDDIPF